jgi:hypothetical protein
VGHSHVNCCGERYLMTVLVSVVLPPWAIETVS